MENTTGMQAVVSTLNTSLSASAIWGVIGQIMPWAVTLTLVGLGFGLVKKYLRKTKNVGR